jgi:hypothetical protein
MEAPEGARAALIIWIFRASGEETRLKANTPISPGDDQKPFSPQRHRGTELIISGVRHSSH